MGEAISRPQSWHECASCQQGITREVLWKENVWAPMSLVHSSASRYCHSLLFLGKAISLLAPTERANFFPDLKESHANTVVEILIVTEILISIISLAIALKMMRIPLSISVVSGDEEETQIAWP